MSITSAETSRPTIQPAMPPILLGADLLDSVQAAIPLPPADAPLGWQHPSRPQLIATIAGYNPSDALQALLAGQVVTARLVAADMRWRSSAPDLPVGAASRLRRLMGRLTRAAAELERRLRWLQTREAPGGVAAMGALAMGALNLSALIALAEQDHHADRTGSNATHSLPPGTCPGGENLSEPTPAGAPATGALELATLTAPAGLDRQTERAGSNTKQRENLSEAASGCAQATGHSTVAALTAPTEQGR